MTCIQLLRGETRTQVGRVVLHLKIRHDKGIDERPDLVGELIKRETNQHYNKEVVKHKKNTAKTKRTKDKA